MKHLGMALTMALRTVLPPLAFMLLGSYIDSRTGSSWYWLVFMVFGALTGIHQAYKMLLAMGKSAGKQKHR